MSTKDADVFHAFIVRYGCGIRVDRHKYAGLPIAKTFDTIEGFARGLLASAREHVPGLPEIHFDYVYSGAVNAYAFKSEERYFIGLTTGTIYMLQLVLGRMMAHSGLFANIGTPQDETDSMPPLTTYSANADQMAEAKTALIHPTTVPRLSYVQHLFTNAVHFVVSHELAHITRGHVDYRKSKGRTALIAELWSDQADDQEMLERQVLEADADARS